MSGEIEAGEITDTQRIEALAVSLSSIVVYECPDDKKRCRLEFQSSRKRATGVKAGCSSAFIRAVADSLIRSGALAAVGAPK